jgi:hypothetical protein
VSTLERGFIDGEYEDAGIRGCNFIVGQRNSGKTFEMARRLNACLGGCVLFDSLSRNQHALKGGELFTEPAQLDAALMANRGRRFRFTYQPRSGSRDEHFEAVCNLARAYGWFILAIDEIDAVCGSRFGESRMPPGLNHLVNYGRHDRISLIACARKPQRVSKDYLGECLNISVFYTSEFAAIKNIEEFIGPEDAARIRGLGRFEYLDWTEPGPAVLSKGGRKL